LRRLRFLQRIEEVVTDGFLPNGEASMKH